ncbi:hypothetical protein ACWT_2318 [Actinoplanes sp. SE50]|uniref:STAS domain-containing protein n=1 Tax=unclassified Actinoplanes TaxID=2626549 RepID=UPI00023ED3E0|nr:MULTISPECIES: STAS domain-containing protein [unclassified Actinoplanes]AEV83340.1 hypothetical protein ACPL_2445 [Actinoplanes sp. SE50/110]ATO81733.1 hypothetical protein ACWT_2318 [Actinoplanes sp. SE50]SLL99141.1 hypothetical protein ACSP50_2372 [Actinoplanes sp. SE50/110]
MRIVRYDGPGAVRLALHGELDLATTGRVTAEAEAALATPGVRRLILDVAGLTFCDSSGIDALVNIRTAAQTRGATCQVVGAQGIVHRSMQATGVLALLSAPDRGAA